MRGMCTDRCIVKCSTSGVGRADIIDHMIQTIKHCSPNVDTHSPMQIMAAMPKETSAPSLPFSDNATVNVPLVSFVPSPGRNIS